MLKLRKILLHDLLYYLIIFISIIYFFVITTLISYKSIYSISDNSFDGKISNIVIDGDKLSFILNSEENLKCNYYIKTFEEKKYLEKNLKEGYGLTVVGELNEPSNNTIPNTFNYKKYLYNKKIHYILNVESIEINNKKINIFFKIKNYLKDTMIKSNNSDYLLTFILGDKNLINDEVFTNYQILGVTHLFAISGMHITLFSTFLLFALKKLKVSENRRYVFTIVFLLFYAFLTNFSSSVLRASIFFSLLSLNKIYYTNIKTINIFLLTISILIFINPFILYDLGAQYSIITSGGLILSMDKLQSKNYLVNLIKVSLVAFIFSLPITAINFYEVNLFSLINNLIFVPFVSIIVYPFTLITFIFSFLSPILAFLINVMEGLSRFFSQFTLYCNIPKISISLWVIYYILLIIMIKTNNKKCLIILLTSLIINRYKYIFDNNCYVYFLDVKQGDSAILISEHHQEVIMIDTGGKLEYEIETWQKKKTYQISTNTITFLKSIGINKIDTLLLSHGDEDHAGETINIVNNMKVKNVIFNNNDYNNLEKNIINVLNKKNINYYKNVKHMDFSNTRIQFLNTGLFNDENEDSNVISLNLYNNIFLFMGDAGVKKENEIMSNYELGSIDVLKVGHHGSSTSTSLDFIKTIKPKYSIISAGKNNRYGHPKESVLDTLSLSKIYRTDLNGSIMMKLSKNGLIINKFNP